MSFGYMVFDDMPIGPAVASDSTNMRAILGEGVISFTLVMCLMHFWDDHFYSKDRLCIALTLGSVIFSGINTVGPFTGACFNPAVFFGIKIFRIVITGNSDEF